MPERLDRVTIALTSRDPVVLDWAARDALLDRFAHLESCRPIREAFDAVGATRPVVLTLAQKRDLLEIIEHWSHDTPEGFDALPEGIFPLRNALYDDLHDAARESK